MFQTVLVANRGEIACRVIRTLRKLGIRSVAVYSDADEGARHVLLADVAVRLGGAAAADSYLNMPSIIAAARDTGAEAIHPGYGFLAENAAFARACGDAGIVFIGPSVEALEVMGDKISAKAQVVARGVPVVPGLAEPGLTDEQLVAATVKMGFPALIKPSAGGGGKGMHVVTSEPELAGAIAAARREAASSFGDDTLFVERLVRNPRHIEVQVLADAHGNTVHLGERECSLQRRHQKVIEEAPSPLLDAATRERIGQAAVETARSVSYLGAGTVEFIVSADAPDEFFFMEMNTRLQVEHPVTEMITGIDLVEWQLRVASGEPLDFSQQDVTLTGHAIEARVYAEDPERAFLPTGGTVTVLAEPSGDGIRVDTALIVGLTVSSDYDPMLAKVIAWGPDRVASIDRLQAALSGTVTLGVTNNVQFLKLLLAEPDVRAGLLDTGLIERTLGELEFRSPDAAVFTAAALVLRATESHGSGPWERGDGWRLGAAAPISYRLRAAEKRAEIRLTGSTASIDGADSLHASITIDGNVAHVRLGSLTTTWRFDRSGDRLILSQDGAVFTVQHMRFERAAAAAAGAKPELRSPMPGAVVAVHAVHGAMLEPGDPVLAIEAMKMEHVLTATVRGIVSIEVEVGSQVTADQVVAIIAPAADLLPGDAEEKTA
jgi:acetyl-CoA/propionyl-CoA carboxylase biotin carboxyl carrier protein